ncbi:MAG TPA: glutamine synthetase, partial [Elusimicrobiales bacterium]|nr:glutamine synthetase [Elusimicrobiales bacterium]
MPLRRDKNKIKEILKIIKSKNVKFLKLWFVDILGAVKSITVSHREFEHAISEGMGFDGSSI